MIQFSNSGRRHFIKLLGLGIYSSLFQACATPQLRKLANSWNDWPPPKKDLFNLASPIWRSVPSNFTNEFAGDNPSVPHRIFWNYSNFSLDLTKKAPSLPEEKVKVVVIGGGMSGLLSTYLLRKYQPVLLEASHRFGGNSKGESWEGIDYSIGAAYFTEASPDSPLHHLYQELDLYSLVKTKSVSDAVGMDGKIFENFWDGETDPRRSNEFKLFKQYFLNVLKEENGHQYPTIPVRSKSGRQLVNELDKFSFKQWLLRVLNLKSIHPHIEQIIDHYCWSTFATRWDELSAAVGLNAFSSEFGKIYVAPGGNSRIAERILERLYEHLSPTHLRTHSLVVKVEVIEENVHVTYQTTDGKLQKVIAEYAVLACPKFVVSKILSQIEPERQNAITKIKYHSYLVANALLNSKAQNSTPIHPSINDFDTFLFTAMNGITDVISSRFTQPHTENFVLTLYKGIPHDGARPFLYSEDAFSKYAKEFKTCLENEIFPLLNINSTKLVDLRIARWGHPMPVASPGLIADGIVDLIHAPFKNRIFFAEQDNWVNPAIETSFTEAIWAAENIISKYIDKST